VKEKESDREGLMSDWFESLLLDFLLNEVVMEGDFDERFD